MKRTSASSSHPVDTNRSFADFLTLAVKGFCMGIADVIPGISGGTIAFMFGIYEDLIKAIKSFDMEFIRAVLKGDFRAASALVAWRFLGALVFGIGCAIVVFSKIVTWLIANYPVFVNAFFFGLILMTVPIIARVMKRWSAGKLAALAVSTVATYFFVQLVPVATPNDLWFVFLCGAVAICAMILPGISGAFLLLLLGKYSYILTAVHERDLVVIAVFCAGILTGILSFVRVLEWLFARFHDLTIAVLTGFVLGSLNKIWPWKKVLETVVTESGKMIPVSEANILPASGTEVWMAAGLATAGAAAAFGLSLIPQKHLR